MLPRAGVLQKLETHLSSIVYNHLNEPLIFRKRFFFFLEIDKKLMIIHSFNKHVLGPDCVAGISQMRGTP